MILRVSPRARYVVVDSRTVDDERLSFRARGLLVWLLNKPDNWTVNSNAIKSRGREGRDAIRTALNELESAGYLQRRTTRDPKTGRVSTEQNVLEHPQLTGDGFPGPGYPGDGEPGAGKPGVLASTKTKEPKSSSSALSVTHARCASDDDDSVLARLFAIAKLDERHAAEVAGKPFDPIGNVDSWLDKVGRRELDRHRDRIAELRVELGDVEPDELVHLCKQEATTIRELRPTPPCPACNGLVFNYDDDGELVRCPACDPKLTAEKAPPEAALRPTGTDYPRSSADRRELEDSE